MAKKEKLTKNKELAKGNSLLDERIFTLEKKRDHLAFLCQTLDPFKPIEENERKLLKEFNLDLVDDPYRLTALLITLMEDTITELTSLKGTNTEDHASLATTTKN